MRYFYYVTKEGSMEKSICGKFKDKGELIADTDKVIVFIEELTEDEYKKVVSKYGEGL